MDSSSSSPPLVLVRGHDERRHLQHQFERMWRDRVDSADLELVCDDGQVDCHRILLAVHSRFMFSVFHDIPTFQSTLIIPEAKKKEVQAVIKLLYTGKLKIRRYQVEQIREIMENVLHIDAKIDLEQVMQEARGNKRKMDFDDSKNKESEHQYSERLRRKRVRVGSEHQVDWPSGDATMTAKKASTTTGSTSQSVVDNEPLDAVSNDSRKIQSCLEAEEAKEEDGSTRHVSPNNDSDHSVNNNDHCDYEEGRCCNEDESRQDDQDNCERSFPNENNVTDEGSNANANNDPDGGDCCSYNADNVGSHEDRYSDEVHNGVKEGGEENSDNGRVKTDDNANNENKGKKGLGENEQKDNESNTGCSLNSNMGIPLQKRTGNSSKLVVLSVEHINEASVRNANKANTTVNSADNIANSDESNVSRNGSSHDDIIDLSDNEGEGELYHTGLRAAEGVRQDENAKEDEQPQVQSQVDRTDDKPQPGEGLGAVDASQAQSQKEARGPGDTIEPEVIDIVSSDDEDDSYQNSTVVTAGEEETSSSMMDDDMEIEEVVLCNYCEKAFNNRSALAEHLMEHESLQRIKRENDEMTFGNDDGDLNDNRDGQFEVIEAPTIISKHTSSLSSRSRSKTLNAVPPMAPKVVAKRTGLPIIPAQLQPPVLPQVPQQQVQQQLLPPPIPQPPQEGMVINRGKWVSVAELERRKARQRASNRGPQRPKDYNYQPVINTLSGRSLPSTYDVEPDGDFPCPEPNCNARYKQRRSLMGHISRNHHTNLKAECPECQQRLSSKAAIKKHLLRHRPESDWPFQCPFCHKKFQAKGDLPKHWNTKKHANDPIPPIGSPQWHQLLAASICAPICDLNSALVSARAEKSTLESKESNATVYNTVTTATATMASPTMMTPSVAPTVNSHAVDQQTLGFAGFGLGLFNPTSSLLAHLALNL